MNRVSVQGRCAAMSVFTHWASTPESPLRAGMLGKRDCRPNLQISTFVIEQGVLPASFARHVF